MCRFMCFPFYAHINIVRSHIVRHTLSDRRRVGRKITIRLILATVMSRIDCCNSALAGLPQSTLAPLQRVQNAAARLVFELGAREHVIPSLLQLHWLPVHWRIQYKLCCLMHSVPHGNCPVYLKNTVQSASGSRP